MNKINNSVNEFISTAFNIDGSYNTDREYAAVAGKNKKNCRWCIFKDDFDLCPKKDRICE